ncbi:hypothetical protein [Pseudomonas fluorescens]|uniref:hypothetical protein n=1 Tax=Pseudomonas fluorescens TaxID=294 RepID=UPI0016554CE9|nr:hypothetical protein [Pseudomonas fluorescens]MBC8787106.1 hypothetical protein [Pseudomonas fluorescens]
MRKEIVFGALVIAGALSIYAINFNEWLGFSENKGDWGTFGDFVGGFSNPIITFITMCMLIKSIDLQKDANESIIDQNTQIKNQEIRQREIEDLRSFESTFYSLAEVARQEYRRLRIKDSNGNEYLESLAVSYIEEEILRQYTDNLTLGKPSDFLAIFNKIDEQSSMSLFSSVRSFYILFKITIDACPPTYQERYIEICNYTMPVRFLNLVCIAQAYSDWQILKLLAKYRFFEKDGIRQYLGTWDSLKINSIFKRFTQPKHGLVRPVPGVFPPQSKTKK